MPDRYPDLFGKGDPIIGYVHDHVLREMLGGSYGVNAVGSPGIQINVAAGQTFSYAFSTILNGKYKPADIQLIGYVLDYKGPQDSEALNAASMPLIETSVTGIASYNFYKVYPNPNYGVLNLIYETERTAKVDIIIRNLQGREVYRQLWYKEAGKSFFTFSTDDLKPGIYFLELNNGYVLHYQKVVMGINID